MDGETDRWMDHVLVEVRRGRPTQDADEEGLVDQLVSLGVHQVELEGEAPSRLLPAVAELQPP